MELFILIFPLSKKKWKYFLVKCCTIWKFYNSESILVIMYFIHIVWTGVTFHLNVGHSNFGHHRNYFIKHGKINMKKKYLTNFNLRSHQAALIIKISVLCLLCLNLTCDFRLRVKHVKKLMHADKRRKSDNWWLEYFTGAFGASELKTKWCLFVWKPLHARQFIHRH